MPSQCGEEFPRVQDQAFPVVLVLLFLRLSSRPMEESNEDNKLRRFDAPLLLHRVWLVLQF